MRAAGQVAPLGTGRVGIRLRGGDGREVRVCEGGVRVREVCVCDGGKRMCNVGVHA